MYSPKIDESNTKTAGKGISLSELMKKPEVHEAYEKSRGILPMESLVDRVIKITSFSIENKANFQGTMVDMVTMHYTLADDDSNTERTTTTQAKAILEVLNAMPKSVFEEYGYITGMIQMRKMPNGGRSYSFVL